VGPGGLGERSLGPRLRGAAHRQLGRLRLGAAHGGLARRARGKDGRGAPPGGALSLRERPSLFVGLSVRDINLQVQIIQAAGWHQPYPAVPPRLCFAPQLHPPVRNSLLPIVYGASYVGATADTIDQAAELPLRAKPLFAALYVLLLYEKLIALLGRSTLDLRMVTRLRAELDRMVVDLEGRYGAGQVMDEWCSDFARELPTLIGRSVRLYRGQTTTAAESHYLPITKGSLLGLREIGESDARDLDRLVLIWSLLRDGLDAFGWRMELPQGAAAGHGHFVLRSSTGRGLTVLLCSDPIGALAKLVEAGGLDLTEADIVVVHARGRGDSMTFRTPGRRDLPRRGDVLTELWLDELMDLAPSIEELSDLFAQEVRARLAA
jgi:hypothetical protein